MRDASAKEGPDGDGRAGAIRIPSAIFVGHEIDELRLGEGLRAVLPFVRFGVQFAAPSVGYKLGPGGGERAGA